MSQSVNFRFNHPHSLQHTKKWQTGSNSECPNVTNMDNSFWKSYSRNNMIQIWRLVHYLNALVDILLVLRHLAFQRLLLFKLSAQKFFRAD